MNLKNWYITRKENKIKDDIKLMMMELLMDNEHQPTMFDILDILSGWLILRGHKQKYINKVLNDHYGYILQKSKSLLNQSVEELEKS